MVNDNIPILRRALPDDAEKISDLLLPYARQQIVLPRDAADILAHIENFIVAEAQDQVVGAIALRDFGDGLEEVRSLVVHFDYAGRGLGSELVKAAVAFARERRAKKVFALTLRPQLFKRLGFEQVPKDLFPQKVWSDCSICPKKDCCDEYAVQLILA